MLLIKITPLELEQAGFVEDKVAKGFGRMVTVTTEVAAGQLPDAGTVYV